MQRAVGGAAAQGFIAENAPFRKTDDRLEQAVQTALSQDGAQCTQLFGVVMDCFLIKKDRAFSRPVLLFHDRMMTV
jgi:hypothetical protein